MGIYDATWNPWASLSPYTSYPSSSYNPIHNTQGAEGAGPKYGGSAACGASPISQIDPFAAYAERAIAQAVGRFFANASGGTMSDYAARPDLQFGMRMMMQQLNQSSGPAGIDQAGMGGAQDMPQQYGEMIVMMALFMMFAQRMMQGANGRDFGSFGGGGPQGANWGGGQRVNNGWPSVGTETEKGGGVTGPTGTIRGGSASGQQLAHAAERTAMSMGSVGMCYRGAKASIARATGVQLHGGSAYMAADQLARSGRFREVSVSQSQLRNLPAGAVVVWGQTNRSPHGHISIALGDGREASDHVQRQITSLRGASNFRVFVPADMANSF